MNSLKNKIILVTGGAQGLGKAITETLSRKGATVLIGDIQDQKSKELVKSLNSNHCHTYCYHLDVSNEENIHQSFEDIRKTFGRLDVLINNAGIDVTKPVDEISIEEWSKVIDINLKGAFLTSKKALELMYKQKNGHIINISSTASKRTWPNASAYHASKWGLVGFSHALFTEARKNNVKVSVVISGGMKTPFILDRFPDVDPNSLQDPQNVAQTILFILTQPAQTIIPEVMVIPMTETSWP
jgi:NADP-dependent 3-hydroxy acid dehydrogenase YdfG